MDIGYVVLSRRPNYAHSQLDCSRLVQAEEKSGLTASLIQVRSDEDGLYITPGDAYRLSIEECPSCGDPLTWSWQNNAPCFGSGRDMITCTPDEAEELIEEFCSVCPVKTECAEFALSRPSGLVGIWGGLHIRANGGNTQQHRQRAFALQQLSAMVSMARHSEDAA